jgi:hypothetical protein
MLQRSSAAVVLFATLFAFGATSYDDYGTLQRDGVYYFADEPAEVIARLNTLGLDHEGKMFDTNIGYDCPPSLLGPSDCVSSKDLWISVTSDFCGPYFDARVEFRDWGDTTRATLERIDHDCERDRDDIRELQTIFEREIIAPLGGFGTRREAERTEGGGDAIFFDERVDPSVSYEVGGSASAVIESLASMEFDNPGLPGSPPVPDGQQVLTLTMQSEVCPPAVVVRVLVRELTPQTAEVVLLDARGCAGDARERSLFQLEFDRRVIQLLRSS